jgi:hypothetical protein
MGDLLMIVITIGALALCQFYVKWCDRIATAEPDAYIDSTVVVTPEDVTA